MTQDEIIRSPIGREQLVALAREAGAEFYAETLCVNGKDAHDFIERFAALVAQNYMAKACGGCVIKKCYKRMDAEIEAAVLAEREACAKMCEDDMGWLDNGGGELCAKAIRRRGMDLLTQHSQAIGEYDDYPRSNS